MRFRKTVEDHPMKTHASLPHSPLSMRYMLDSCSFSALMSNISANVAMTVHKPRNGQKNGVFSRSRPPPTITTKRNKIMSP